MTPEQANRAAAILQLHAPSDPEGYAAASAAIAHLRALAAPPARWDYDPDTRALLAGEPGGMVRMLPNVSDFAQDVALAWRAYPEPVALEWSVEWGEATRATLKSRRWALAARLDTLRMAELAQAVRDVRLVQRGEAVLAQYAPEGVPLRIERR